MRHNGFTLAELLIALAILGVIATFAIPKVLNSQQNGQFNAIGKEAAGMIAEAYQVKMLNGGITAATGTADLTHYFNYVSVDTSGATIDSQNGQGTWDCGFGGNLICLRLHNGTVIFYDNTETYAGTANTNAISFMVDPDGEYCGGNWCSGKGVWFWIYANGRILTSETLISNTTNSNGAHSPHWAEDSPWFDWGS